MSGWKKSGDEDVDQRGPLSVAGGEVTWCGYYEKQSTHSSENKNVPKTQRDMNRYVYNSLLHHSQKIEGRGSGPNVVHAYNSQGKFWHMLQDGWTLK